MNIPTPTRVPFRGTHFVEAAAFDSVVNQLHSLQTKADTMAAASAIPADGPIEAEALAELSARAGGSQPSHALGFIAEQDAKIDALMEAHGDATEALQATEAALRSEQGLHCTTKEQLAGAQKDLGDFAAFLRGESPSPYSLHIKEQAESLKAKILADEKAADMNGGVAAIPASPVPGDHADTESIPAQETPTPTGGNASS